MNETFTPDIEQGASEYHQAMLALLEWIWGRDFMAPGGSGSVARMVKGLDLRGKTVLDVGSGLGGPAFILARDFGARVTGTDLEGHLVDRATMRAAELGLSDRVQFFQVSPGPMQFSNGQFDVVFSAGAITQTSDKLGMFKEIHRILKRGGVLRIYDWMKSPGPYSEDMMYWFKMEGLTYAMETLERHGELLYEAGFCEVELEDASEWYRCKVREEYELLSGEGYPKVVDLIGQTDADHLLEDWRAMVVVCEKGEMRQAYLRARKGE